MPATILTAVTPVKVILFGKHHQAVFIEVKKIVFGWRAGHDEAKIRVCPA
jgi:hypothetical protein